jgi:cytochrome c peroxidase
MTTGIILKGALISFAAVFLTAAIGVLDAPGNGLTPNEQLGKSIFFDQNLSIDQNQSCAACHGPEVGWTGPLSHINAGGAVYEGSILGRFGNRKPPSAAYATLSPVFHQDKKGLFVGGNFWDGRATGEKLGNPAADQAQGPFLNPVEQALPDAACVVYRVCTASYPVSFEAVWGAGACDIGWPGNIDGVCALEGGMVALSAEDRLMVDMAYNEIALSIAAYEDSPEVNAFSSKFDLTKLGKVKLTKEEQFGFALFKGKGKCRLCHLSNGRQPFFTDFTFDNLGVPKNPENPVYDVDPDFVDYGLGGFLQNRGKPVAVYEAELGKHKVPTLRNVDLRSDPGFVKAYAHNGYFKTLEGIVNFYNTRDVKPTCPGDYTEVQALAADEEAAIVAFLKTLSDGFKP